GEDEFLKIWHNFEFPSTWARQQNPITHLGSYFFSDYLHLSMIMPFLINRAISTTMLNKAFIEHLITSCATTKKHTVDQLLSLCVSFSKMAFL
ncbi:3297_t:CDS:1, partial [Entrophospora sp. SA101]